MDFLKITGKDIKNIFKNRFARISVIAIVIVPLLYSLLYLDAFWDPYERVKDMPIAVVNLDKGTTLDGDNVNYGNDIIDNLKDNKEVKWQFTDAEDAEEGVKGNKYYAELVIPEDFSQKVIAAKEGTPELAEISFIGNDKKNFLASQINRSVKEVLSANIIESISNNYVTVAFEKLFEVKDGLVEAADGSKLLSEGIETLNNNVPALVDGVTQLGDGSDKLYNGQVTLNSAISQVNAGLNSVNEKVPTLGNGINALYNGSNDLKAGLDTALNGSSQLSAGSNKLYTAFSSTIYPAVNSLKAGANTLNNSLEAGKPQIDKLNSAAETLKDASATISQSSTSLNAGYSQVKNGVDELVSGVNASSQAISSVGAALIEAAKTNPDVANDPNVQAALQILQSMQAQSADTASKIKELTDGTNYLQSKLDEFNSGVQGYTAGVKEFTTGATTLTSNLEAVSNGVDQIASGLNTLEAGLNENTTGSFGEGLKTVASSTAALNSGINTLGEGAKNLNSGLNEVNSNVPALSNGIQALYAGSSQMVDGSNDLVDGQSQLKDGIGQLNSKVPELQDGVTKLYDGSKELYTALNDGAIEISNGLKNPASVMGDFVSKPIDLNDEAMNPIPNYGTGFAPYFIPLSLWIGAIMMFFVISSKVEDETNKFNKVFGKFLSYGFVGIVQAILVSAVVLMLGLEPASKLMFFVTNIFLSLVFIAIIQCLISLLGDAGRLLAIVLLILQLTACGGTFPLEVVPNFFRVLNPFMPFTYALEALREVISATTIDYSVLVKDASILGLLLVVFLTTSVLFINKGERLTAAVEEKKAA